MNNKTLKITVKEKIISKNIFVEHVLRTVTGFIKEGRLIKPINKTQDVIKLPPGGLILPYFKDRLGKWKVVLVNQYRVALQDISIEAPGGMIDAKEIPCEALGRELREETGIRVKPESIKIVLNEYVHPSLLAPTMFGGIVEISVNLVQNKKRGGKKSENEWTQVEISDLAEILRKRESGLVTLDLMTSRLIDEVAKATGLLAKKY